MTSTANYLVAAYKQMGTTEIVAIASTIVIILLCLTFLILAIARRLYNARRYRILDDLRATQSASLKTFIDKNVAPGQYMSQFWARPGSLKWIALEDVLFSLAEDEANRPTVSFLFEQLRYIDYYSRMAKTRKNISRAAAIAKLGRMGNSTTAQQLLAMLDTRNIDTIAVTVRAIAKTGDAPILAKLIKKIPELLERNLVSKKTVDSSFIAAGPRVTSILAQFGNTCESPAMTASILGILNSFPVNREVYDLAASHVGHPDPEVRSKAVKLILPCEEKLGILHETVLLPLLRDPVWFVRLQAVRTLGNRKRKEYASEIASLVLDEKWQIRNEASIALTFLGKEAIDTFLSLLKSNDEYVTASICEEIEKTGYVDILLGLVKDRQDPDASKAKEILTIMVKNNFTSPLGDFARSIQVELRKAGDKTTLTKAKVS